MPEQRAEPWKTGFRSYAGWVPNIRSHLSFSLIGAARKARSFTQPTFDDPTRIVLVLQDRLINDYPYPGWLARRLYPDIEGRWFMSGETAATEIPVRREGKLVAERDRQGMLQGTVHFLPHHRLRNEERAVQSNVDELADLLNTKRQFTTGAQVRAFETEARQFLESAGRPIVYRFALMRTGECRLWYEHEVDGWSIENHDQVAAQAYYFIKDVVHDHTHHDPTSDQITPLIYFDPAATEAGHEDELKWRRETMWSLSREVERLNRGGNLVDQHRALGIIAYAEEFQATLVSHVRDASTLVGFRDNTTVHDFDFTRLKASIKALSDVKSARLAQRTQKWIAGAAIFVSCVALISSLVSTHNAALPRDPNGVVVGERLELGSLDWLLPAVAAAPLSTALLVSLSLGALISFFNVGGAAGLYNRTQRVLSQFVRAFSVTFVESTRGQRWVATLGNVFFAILAASICYVQVRLIAKGGTW